MKIDKKGLTHEVISFLRRWRAIAAVSILVLIFNAGRTLLWGLFWRYHGAFAAACYHRASGDFVGFC